tara:strand:- start:351 stop:590 length:240 start_codon:yes stop_codon:yes gene_type:complete
MPKRSVYLQDNGIVAITTRVSGVINPSTGEEWTDEEIAKKCTPTGKKYGFIEDSDLPADGNFRDAWTVDEADLTDGVGD